MPILLRPTQNMSEKTCERHGVESSECIRSHRIEGAIIGGSIGAAIGGTFGRFRSTVYTALIGAGMGAMFPDAATAMQQKREGKDKSGRAAARKKAKSE